jgi:hypothetical protein
MRTDHARKTSDSLRDTVGHVLNVPVHGFEGRHVENVPHAVSRSETATSDYR